MNKLILLVMMVSVASSVTCQVSEYTAIPEPILPKSTADYNASANQFLDLQDCFSFQSLSDALKSLSSDFFNTLSDIDRATDIETAKEIAKAALNQMGVLGDVISELKQ